MDSVSGEPCREKLVPLLCHPLCACAKCRPLVGMMRQETEDACVAIDSQDEMGNTGNAKLFFVVPYTHIFN